MYSCNRSMICTFVFSIIFSIVRRVKHPCSLSLYQSSFLFYGVVMV